jgi:tetratricopeptide (TPR) repeat protein
MRDYLRAVLMLGLMMGAGRGMAVGQGNGGGAAQVDAATAAEEAEFPDRPELLRRIALYESAARRGEALHFSDAGLAKVYLGLASMYADLAMYPKAEEAARRGIALRRSGPESELAVAIKDLSMLHIAMGDLGDAEKEGLEALRIRERMGDPMVIADSWSELASVYLRRREFKKAEEFGLKAMNVLDGGPGVDPVGRIAVRFAVARALCESRECAKAIPLLKQSIELGEGAYGKDGLPVGLGYYLLGYAYWHTGEMAEAAEWMERGTTRMKVELGWGHPVYIDALGQYALFLRGRGQVEAAAAVEREVRQAEAVVDVRSLGARPVANGVAGLR